MTGQEMVNAARKWLARYTVMTPAQNLVMVLYALMTWRYQALSRTTPYVEITGVSGSGKTRIMKATGMLCRGFKMVNTIRVAAMCRYITQQANECTIGVDEAERLSAATFNDARSMLASGYEEGGTHMVTEGKLVAQYHVWCPKLFTSTGSMTAVLHNRSIPIWATTGHPEASLSLEIERAEATAAEIIAAVKAWLETEPKTITVIPTWLKNERDVEIWTAIFSLAAMLKLDKRTMDELTAASVDLSALRGIHRACDQKIANEQEEQRSYAARLIADVHAVLQDGETVIATRVLLERLHALPTGPWRHYGGPGVALDAVKLGQLLGVFGIESKTVRLGPGRKAQTAMGYSVQALRRAQA